MRALLLLTGILLTFECFGQLDNEEDLHGFWLQHKTTFKNPADKKNFPGFEYYPIHIHYYHPNNSFVYVDFEVNASYGFNSKHYKSGWKLLPEEKSIKVFNLLKPNEFTLLPVHHFKPDKKLELIHKTDLILENGNSFDTTVVELIVKFKKCSAEEALNVSKVDGLFLYNKEISKVEWTEYAYDLELKDEIIFSNQINANESMSRQFDPVLDITQEDARAYCEWKARQIKSYYGLNVVVRLPTKEEWEQVGSAIKNGSQYRMDIFSFNPDLDFFYLKKPIKLLEDT
ncbi:MAG: SUMF1/EgtB/PvdO family nonheme iron enzyme, partial [Bacteroidota bacterium]